MMNKPYSESCDQNKHFILDVLSPYFEDGAKVLEIGSGTGQHALFFASQAPQITWQTSDQVSYLPGIQSWLSESGQANLPAPLELEVSSIWPEQIYDLLFSANTFHIMNHQQVELCLSRCVSCLKPKGYLVVYGPFNYDGKYTSSSNERFDHSLKSRDPQSGIKDFEWIEQIAQKAGLRLLDDIAMPANNRTLIWRYETFAQ
jgi:cyclopropane fatty-acyl-phospholipid synthase-like methyltransferase